MSGYGMSLLKQKLTLPSPSATSVFNRTVTLEKCRHESSHGGRPIEFIVDIVDEESGQRTITNSSEGSL